MPSRAERGDHRRLLHSGHAGDEDARHRPTASTSARTILGSASSSVSSARPSCQRERSCSPISLETTRTSTAGTPARSAARSTPNPSIASTSGPDDTVSLEAPTAAEVWIGVDRPEETGIRGYAGDDGPFGREVGVNRLRADDDRTDREIAAAGEPDM